MRWNRMVGRAALFAALLPLLTCGCVERRLYVRSDPPGAQITVNGVEAGLTPVRVPFGVYGHYEIIASAPGHRRLLTVVPVAPPWWEYTPLDFFVENFLPVTLTDEHPVLLKLEPLTASDAAEVDRSEADLRARLKSGAAE